MPDLLDAFLAFALALVVVWIATPVVKTLAWRIGAIDEPRERGLHQFPTPRLGGLAIFVGVLAAGIAFLPHDHQTRGILIGAAVIVVVGVADDLLELSADVKLAGQILAAVVPVASGVRVETMTLPFLGHLDLGTAAYPLTVFGLVAVMNMVNFIDGVDGLAAGVCTIAAITFAVILAVPILDSSFVVAKRIKHGKPVHVADRWHLHHRFANIGFSQRRTVLYLYGWTIALAALALALRFVPYSDDHGHFNLGWSLVMVGFAVPALVASVYLVLVLEILKLKRFRQFQLRRTRMLDGEPPPAETEVDAGVAHELETGEFEIADLER